MRSWLSVCVTDCLLYTSPVVMAMKGVGTSLGPQLMAEIGDVSRFTHKGAITAFAGVCLLYTSDKFMNAVGIDVSKGKSMVAIMRSFGEIVSTPFEIKHTTLSLIHI